MNYDVTVTILDKGFMIDDNGYTTAVQSGSELLNALARIRQAIEAEEEEGDE